MALLNASYGAAGSNGRFARVASGTDITYLPNSGNYVISENAIYPDSSCEVDYIKKDFGLNNVFYFRFQPNTSYKTFQIQYRLKKRYSPSNAVAQRLDTSGAEVWTDWSEWTNEDGSTGDIADAASNVKVETPSYVPSYATWQLTFEHPYSGITTFDKFLYQFRVRVYNAAANTCGTWTVCDVALNYVPAITGYEVKQVGSSMWRVAFNTNWQRDNLRIQVSNSCTSNGKVSGKTYSPIILYKGLPDSKTTTIGDFWFYLSGSIVSNGILTTYFNNSELYAYEDGKRYHRWLGTEPPSTTGVHGIFTRGTHTEAAIADPKLSYDSLNQQLTCIVTSTGAAYDDVNCSIVWTSPTKKECIEEYTMAVNSAKTQWTFTVENPPLDTNMAVRITPIVDGDWKAWEYKNIVVPSNGLVCFNNSFQGSACLKYNQSITLNDEIAGETIDVVGRDYPISRYGGSQSKTLKIDAQMLNSSLTGGDGWKGDLEKLTSQCDWILRIPGGEKYRVFIESLDRSTSSPTNSKLLDISISCKVIGDE